MVLANLRINGEDEYWFEALREGIADIARKTEAEVGEAIERWAFWTDSLSYLQLGNPAPGYCPRKVAASLSKNARYCPEKRAAAVPHGRRPRARPSPIP